MTTRTLARYVPIIDIAFNLPDGMYQGYYNHKSVPTHKPDLISVLMRANRAGVGGILALATSLEESQATAAWLIAHRLAGVIRPLQDVTAAVSAGALPISQFLPSMSGTVGVHPTQASSLFVLAEDTSPRLDKGILQDLVKTVFAAARFGVLGAIGEFGLDDARTAFCPSDLQRIAFTAQMDLLPQAAAAAFGAAGKPHRLPSLLLHLRGDESTAEDFFRIVAPRRKLFAGGIVHSFDLSSEVAKSVVALKLHIGLNGASFRTVENLETIATIPLEWLTVETDSPWCGIRPTHAATPRAETFHAEAKIAAAAEAAEPTAAAAGAVAEATPTTAAAAPAAPPSRGSAEKIAAKSKKAPSGVLKAPPSVLARAIAPFVEVKKEAAKSIHSVEDATAQILSAIGATEWLSTSRLFTPPSPEEDRKDDSAVPEARRAVETADSVDLVDAVELIQSLQGASVADLAGFLGLPATGGVILGLLDREIPVVPEDTRCAAGLEGELAQGVDEVAVKNAQDAFLTAARATFESADSSNPDALFGTMVKGRNEPASVVAVIELLRAIHPGASKLTHGELCEVLARNTARALQLE